MQLTGIGGGATPSSAGLEALVATRLGPEVDRLAAGAEDLAGAEEAAERLEGLFATLLVKEMRRALPEGFFGDGSAADIYGGWFDEHVGEALARDGALDLAGMIKANLSAKSRAAAGEDAR